MMREVSNFFPFFFKQSQLAGKEEQGEGAKTPFCNSFSCGKSTWYSLVPRHHVKDKHVREPAFIKV
jgi:hypothetical protein